MIPTSSTTGFTPEEQAAIDLLEKKAQREHDAEIARRAEQRRLDQERAGQQEATAKAARKTRFTRPAVQILIEQEAEGALRLLEALSAAWKDDLNSRDLEQTAALLVGKALWLKELADRHLARAQRAPIEMPMSHAIRAYTYASNGESARAEAMAGALVPEVPR